MEELAREIEGLLGPQVGVLLAEIGAPSLAALLATVPPKMLAALPEGQRALPALAAVRDVASARNELRVAVATTRTLLGFQLSARGPEHPDTLVERATLGGLALRAGHADGGPALEEAWGLLRSVAGGRDPRVAVVAQNVAQHYVRTGRPTDAEAALETALRLRRATPGTPPEHTALVAAQLGEVRLQLGKVAEALPLLLEAHAATVSREGPTAVRSLARAQVAGTACNRLQRWKEAAALLRPVFESLTPQDDTERRATVGFELGLALDGAGVVEESRRRIDEALRLTRQLGETRGSPHPQLADRLAMMARIHVQRRRTGEAEGLLLEGLDALRRLHGGASAEVGEQQAELGRFCQSLGRDDEALGWFDASVSLLTSSLGPTHAQTVAVVDTEVQLLQKQGEAALRARDKDLASVLLKRAFDLASRSLGHVHHRTRTVRDLLSRHRLA